MLFGTTTGGGDVTDDVLVEEGLFNPEKRKMSINYFQGDSE